MTVTIAALHDAVLARIRQSFPDLRTVDDYRDLGSERDPVALPAVLVQLADLEASDTDDGTGRLTVVAIFEAYLVMGYRTPEVCRAVREAAAALALVIKGQRWGLNGVEPAAFIAAGPDTSSPALRNLETWRVEWRQEVHLGESVWRNDGSVPTLMVSWAPNIGPGHEPDYQPLAGVVLP